MKVVTDTVPSLLLRRASFVGLVDAQVVWTASLLPGGRSSGGAGGLPLPPRVLQRLGQ